VLKAVVPFGHSRIKRGLWLNDYNLRTRSGHRKRGCRITARTDPIKYDVVELFEKPIIDQTVKEVEYLWVAELRVTVRDHAKMRPFLRSNHLKTERLFRFAQSPNALNCFKSHKKRITAAYKTSLVSVAERFKKTLLFGDGFYF